MHIYIITIKYINIYTYIYILNLTKLLLLNTYISQSTNQVDPTFSENKVVCEVRPPKILYFGLKMIFFFHFD